MALESLDALKWLRKHLEQDDSEPRAKSAPHRLSFPLSALCEQIVPLRAQGHDYVVQQFDGVVGDYG